MDILGNFVLCSLGSLLFTWHMGTFPVLETIASHKIFLKSNQQSSLLYVNMWGRKMTARGPWLEKSGPHPLLPPPCVAAPAPVKSPGSVMHWDYGNDSDSHPLPRTIIAERLKSSPLIEPNCAKRQGVSRACLSEAMTQLYPTQLSGNKDHS